MPQDRLLAIYREAYRAEERETYRARIVMADVKDELVRELTLPQYEQARGGGSSHGQPAPTWLSPDVAADLVTLMGYGGVLEGDVYTAWPASPDGKSLNLIWTAVAGLAH